MGYTDTYDDNYDDARQFEQPPPPAINGPSKSSRRPHRYDYHQLESPVIPQSYPPPTNPRGLDPPGAPAPSSKRNGAARTSSGSHRRRESQVYAPPPPDINAGIEAPEAPQRPVTDSSTYRKSRASYSSRAGPAQDPAAYSSTTSSSSADPARRSSTRRQHGQERPHTLNTAIPAPSYAGKNGTSTGRTPISPSGPVAGGGGVQRNSSTATSSSQRRVSVSDRSPLQTLEGRLGSISKEERRARLEDEEANVAREKSLARQQRRVSGPERGSGGSRSVEKRNVTAPAHFSEGGSHRPSRASADYATRDRAAGEYPYGQSARGRDPKYFSGPPATGSKEHQAPVVIHDRAGQLQPAAPVGLYERDRDQQATGLGVYEGSPPSARRTSKAAQLAASNSINRSGSKRLQKPNPADRDLSVAGGRMTQGSVSRDLDDDHHAGPKYDIPPQNPSARQVREQVGFGAGEPKSGAPTQQERHHHLGGMFHHHHDDARRYQFTGPTLAEWKDAPTAALTANELFVEDVPQPAPTGNQAWWEKPQPRRSSGAAKPTGSAHTAYDMDGAHDEPTAPTAYRPRLYVKCGPLLRFTGIRKDARGKEVWRGSLLIVTYDKQSDYSSTPTLRLFVQSRELPSAPPAHVKGELAPEHIDPLAGHPRVSRTGKTLFVRPVEDLEQETDLSRVENDAGLFEETRTAPITNWEQHQNAHSRKRDGERAGKYREVRAHRLLAERGVTFWRFNLEVELGKEQARIAYRINRGPAVGFWVPARGQNMNMMFYSCNGFSMSVVPDEFCGPDGMWRDVLNNHVFRPFHVMLGGGDQIYNDAVTKQTELFQEWLTIKNPHHKHTAPFTIEMQDELEEFYLERYCMWFSQGLYGMANGMIPMVNIWDDHDIIDGFGSYPDHFMTSPVFSGVGSVAFKYYMLFQHQSIPEETHREEPSWLLGAAPGPYINQLSRSVFMHLGSSIAFLGLDCRMERTRDSILCQETYDLVFDRLRREIVKGETKHLLVLLGVPIAYPRLNFLENILTSRLMDPIKALGRAGLFGSFVNKFDGGVEILDDLDDHWTAKHHKLERNWFIEELQVLASDKSVRVTILSGDVHLAAVGQFFTNKKLGIPKDRDHRYMPNVISSAIVNTPPPEIMADVLNKRNKIHHLNQETDENMIPLFLHDVDMKPRNNNHLLPRRNWCAIREYQPGSTPPPTPPLTPSAAATPSDRGRPGSRRSSISRSLSLTRRDFTPGGLVRRLSGRGKDTGGSVRRERDSAPPISFYNRQPPASHNRRASSAEVIRPNDSNDSYFAGAPEELSRPNPFHRTPTGLLEKASRNKALNDEHAVHVNLQGGLDIAINCEVNQKDPTGITTPFRLLVPALSYDGPPDPNVARREGRIKSLLGTVRGRRKNALPPSQSFDGEEEFVTPLGTPRRDGSQSVQTVQSQATQKQPVQPQQVQPQPVEAQRLPPAPQPPVQAVAPPSTTAAAVAMAQANARDRAVPHDRALNRRQDSRASKGYSVDFSSVPVDRSNSRRHQAPQAAPVAAAPPNFATTRDVAPPPTSNTNIRDGMPVRKQHRERHDIHPGYAGRTSGVRAGGTSPQAPDGDYSDETLSRTITPDSEINAPRRQRHYVDSHAEIAETQQKRKSKFLGLF